jgi:hypothetical protein
MNTYNNYEARNEDKYSTTPKHPLENHAELSPIPVHEQLAELDHAIDKLTELQKILINRLIWVSNPVERPLPERFDGPRNERQDSEIVTRIKRSVQYIKELQSNLAMQLDDLEI